MQVIFNFQEEYIKLEIKSLIVT